MIRRFGRETLSTYCQTLNGSARFQQEHNGYNRRRTGILFHHATEQNTGSATSWLLGSACQAQDWLLYTRCWSCTRKLSCNYPANSRPNTAWLQRHERMQCVRHLQARSRRRTDRHQQAVGWVVRLHRRQVVPRKCRFPQHALHRHQGLRVEEKREREWERERERERTVWRGGRKLLYFRATKK